MEGWILSGESTGGCPQLAGECQESCPSGSQGAGGSPVRTE